MDFFGHMIVIMLVNGVWISFFLIGLILFFCFYFFFAILFERILTVSCSLLAKQYVKSPVFVFSIEKNGISLTLHKNSFSSSIPLISPLSLMLHIQTVVYRICHLI